MSKMFWGDAGIKDFSIVPFDIHTMPAIKGDKVYLFYGKKSIGEDNKIATRRLTGYIARGKAEALKVKYSTKFLDDLMMREG